MGVVRDPNLKPIALICGSIQIFPGTECIIQNRNKIIIKSSQYGLTIKLL